MKKIIIDMGTEETIHLSQIINYDDPIFAKKNGVLKGMVLKEDKGWILRIRRGNGANGHHDSLNECLARCRGFGYEFFT